MSPAPPSRTAKGHRLSAPAPVQVARSLLAAVAIAHLVIPVLMGIGPDGLRRQITAEHPRYAADQVAAAVHTTITSAAIFHGVLLLLCVLLVWKLPTGRPWTRRLATISQALSIVFSAVSWSSSPMFHAVIPVMDCAQLVMIILLWAPRSARRFFSRRPS